MAEHKKRCVEAENKLDYWLRKASTLWKLKHEYPVYHNKYRMYTLQKMVASEQKPTAITIKKNGVVMITIDRRVCIPYITASQRQLKRSPEFKKWYRVELGCDAIDTFFEELENHGLTLIDL